MGHCTPKRPDPSPEEIRRLCAEIQATWTPQQHDFRAGRRKAVNPWILPMQSISDLTSLAGIELDDDTGYTDWP